MTRDQFLAEMMGKCWHEWEVAFPDETAHDYSMRGHRCIKCGEYWPIKPKRSGPITLPSFSTSPTDILALHQFVLNAEWWPKFVAWAYDRMEATDSRWDTETGFLAGFLAYIFASPDRFAGLVSEYRGYKGGK